MNVGGQRLGSTMALMSRGILSMRPIQTGFWFDCSFRNQWIVKLWWILADIILSQ